MLAVGRVTAAIGDMLVVADADAGGASTVANGEVVRVRAGAGVACIGERGPKPELQDSAGTAGTLPVVTGVWAASAPSATAAAHVAVATSARLAFARSAASGASLARIVLKVGRWDESWPMQRAIREASAGGASPGTLKGSSPAAAGHPVGGGASDTVLAGRFMTASCPAIATTVCAETASSRAACQATPPHTYCSREGSSSAASARAGPYISRQRQRTCRDAVEDVERCCAQPGLLPPPGFQQNDAEAAGGRVRDWDAGRGGIRQSDSVGAGM